MKESAEGCFFEGNCTAELNMHLFVLFIIFIAFNAIEIGSPLILKWKADAEQVGEYKSVLETQIDMETAEVNEEYLELMITFGYLTLFAAAFPLAPTLAFLTVGIEGKIDAYKYLNLVQRPFPERASSIGLWQNILQFLMIAAVITNLGLVILTDDKLELGEYYSWVYFVLVEHVFLIVVWILQAIIPDESEETR